MHQLQRTQIYLPYDLRREIDKVRALSGESLAEYLRKGAEIKLKQDKKQKVDLKKLADEVIGSLKGYRTRKEVLEWEREIRRDRKLADQQWMKRWDEAVARR